MLTPCERCRRHVSIRDEQCPFCRAPNALARLGGAALAAGLALGACDAGEKPKPEQTVPQRTDARMHGIVKDRDGKPLANAGINLYNEGQTRSVMTDASGKYELDHIPPGAYELSINYNGFDEKRGVPRVGTDSHKLVLEAKDTKRDFTLEVRDMDIAMPYGAPPARRRAV